MAEKNKTKKTTAKEHDEKARAGHAHATATKKDGHSKPIAKAHEANAEHPKSEVSAAEKVSTPKKEKKPKPAKPVAKRKGAAKTGKDKKELIKRQNKIKNKARHNFRRRIGNRWTHNVTDKKWDKWRKPRGIDIQRKQNYGIIPDSGYRTPREIRGLHPSGFKEVLVHNPKQATLATGDVVVRIAAAVGLKKRKEIVQTLNDKKIRIVN